MLVLANVNVVMYCFQIVKFYAFGDTHLSHAAKTGSGEGGEAADRGGTGANIRRLPSVRNRGPFRCYPITGTKLMQISVIFLSSKQGSAPVLSYQKPLPH